MLINKITISFFVLCLTVLSSYSIFAEDSESVLYQAYENHQSGLQIQGGGIVIEILPGDNEGSRHQRFILRLATGQTLLIAHNIDLAQKIDNLKLGDTVEFYGEYAWNSEGGVVHWTHHDPQGGHLAGWLKYNGQTYQ